MIKMEKGKISRERCNKNDLKDTILKYVNNQLIVPSKNQLYFGNFYDKIYEKNTRRTKFPFERERKGSWRGISGNLSFNVNGFPTILVGLEEECLDLVFLNSGLKIKVHPYQITKENKLEEAISKEDWITPSPLIISIPGEYHEHIESIKKTRDQYLLSEKNMCFFLPIIN